MWNSTDHREFGTFQFTFPHTQQLIVQLTKDKGLQNSGRHQRQDKWSHQPQDIVWTFCSSSEKNKTHVRFKCAGTRTRKSLCIQTSRYSDMHCSKIVQNLVVHKILVTWLLNTHTMVFRLWAFINLQRTKICCCKLSHNLHSISSHVQPTCNLISTLAWFFLLVSWVSL